MRQVRISDQAAMDVVAALGDDVVFAVEKEEEMAKEIAEVDALLESVDRELVADERTETVRITRDTVGQVRARRARRRADRVALRSLPVRLIAVDALEGEVA